MTEHKDSMFTAIVVGGTGATGRCLMRELLLSEKCASVTAIVRREVSDVEGMWGANAAVKEKLKQSVVNFDELGNYENEFKGFDEGFFLLGTTRAQAGSSEGFRKVDYTYTMDVLRLMKKGGIRHCHLMSSAGANANSYFLYQQTKGQTENECRELGFPKLSIYRPSVLFTPREQSRPGEALLQKIFPKSWGMPVEVMAKVFVKHAEANLHKEQFNPELFENGDIWALNTKYSS